MKAKPKRFFDFDALAEICCMKIPEFEKYGGKPNICKDGQKYFYRDNGANVLGIAHLDSVQSYQYCGLLEHPLGARVYSPACDDRIGAYVLLKLLPAMGCKIDVLLTEGEESGRSTAQFFKPEKKYNWMFQFDRMGDDVVTYMYGDEDLEKRLRKCEFWNINHGMVSDISYMEDLGIKGFNVGCGYHDYHGPWAYCELEELFKNVKKFFKFYWTYKDKKMPHTKKEYESYSYGRGYGNNWCGHGRGSATKNVQDQLDFLKPGIEEHSSMCVCPLCCEKRLSQHPASCACGQCLENYRKKRDNARPILIGKGSCYCNKKAGFVCYHCKSNPEKFPPTNSSVKGVVIPMSGRACIPNKNFGLIEAIQEYQINRYGVACPNCSTITDWSTLSAKGRCSGCEKILITVATDKVSGEDSSTSKAIAIP